jgi:Cys-rich protein (TIGR01571 family)
MLRLPPNNVNQIIVILLIIGALGIMADFDNGLFGCFDDITVCLITFFVPCYQVAQTKAKLDGRVQLSLRATQALLNELSRVFAPEGLSLTSFLAIELLFLSSVDLCCGNLPNLVLTPRKTYVVRNDSFLACLSPLHLRSPV